MSNTTAIAALSALIEKAGVSPEQLLASISTNATVAQQVTANPTPEATKEATPVNDTPIPAGHISVKGVLVPAPTPDMTITPEVKKAYNSALSRTGNGTLGAGGAKYDNLVAKFALLSGVAQTPAEAAQSASPQAQVSLEQQLLLTLANGLGLTTTKAQDETKASAIEDKQAKAAAAPAGAPTSLRDVIKNYEKQPKTRVWVKNDGTRVPCTEKQYQMWAARRGEKLVSQTQHVATKVDAQPVVVEPLVPAALDLNSLISALAPVFLPMLAQALAPKQ